MSPKTVKASEVGELLLKGARTDEHRLSLVPRRPTKAFERDYWDARADSLKHLV